MVLTFRLQPDSAMTNSLANIITEITAAANQADTDELALLRALAEAPDIRSGATSLPAIGTTPEERVVPETLHYSFDMAVNRVNSHTTAKRHAGKAEGGVKTGLLGIGAGIEGELCRDEQHARSTDYRGRIHVAGTLARREISPALASSETPRCALPPSSMRLSSKMSGKAYPAANQRRRPQTSPTSRSRFAPVHPQFGPRHVRHSSPCLVPAFPSVCFKGGVCSLCVARASFSPVRIFTAIRKSEY